MSKKNISVGQVGKNNPTAGRASGNSLRNSEQYVGEQRMDLEEIYDNLSIQLTHIQNLLKNNTELCDSSHEISDIPEALKKLYRKQQNLIRKQNTARVINDLIWDIRDIDIEKASDKEIEILEKSIADIDFLIKEFGAM